MFYEAQGIGRFLVELGYWLRDGKTESATIDLLQQTPLDPAMGDLSLSAAGRFFMLEFKVGGKPPSEDKKGAVRANVRQNLRTMFCAPEIAKPGDADHHAQLRKISEKCHFIAALDEDPDGDTYSAYLTTIPGIQNVPNGIRGQRRFIKNHLLKSSTHAGVRGPEFEKYLRMIYEGSEQVETGSGQDEAGSEQEKMSYCFHIGEDGSMRWRCAPHFYALIPLPEATNKKKPRSSSQKMK